MIRRIVQGLEAGLVRLFILLFRLMPLPMASAMGGAIARTLGPLLPVHRVGMRNLALAIPELPAQERRRILRGMWDNLGRVAAEFPHLPGTALTGRTEYHGREHLPPADKPVLYFSGHLGNWELSYTIAYDVGRPLALVYRAANNPVADAFICRMRASHCTDMLPKGHRGAAKMARALKQGLSLAMLVDQKMNDGIPVPFFGRPAMTAPAIAQFALRYDMPIYPARVVRKPGCRFEAIVYPPLVIERSGDDEKDALAVMTKINALLESWIREHPEQWFWVHKRWPAVS